ncbi:MAG: hypothetical protein LC637_02470 [Xanthomonadaceae bacterium]|nr:hypothetical protein [Xanthomonadaceae bacterium]
MHEWFQTVWKIALLRAGPQDLPASAGSFALALTAYIGIVVISGVLGQRQTGAAELLVSLGLPILAAAAVLGLRGRPARFNQTLAALFGSGALISLINLPLWLYSATPIPSALIVLALVGLFWSLAVDGHIWRNALECSFAAGLAIAVLILFAQLFSLQALGP